MKKTIITLFVIAGVSSVQATVDLTPSQISTSLIAKGITAADVFTYTLGDWKGSYQSSSLNQNYVKTTPDGFLNIQIGAAAAANKGDYAAVKFNADTPLTLTFDMSEGSSWGKNLANFRIEYCCDVYGYDENGTYTLIGSWSTGTIAANSVNDTYSVSPEITLTQGDYSSYGLIISVLDRSNVGSGAGASINISNIIVTEAKQIPEPTTATLSLLTLAGLAARRRRR